MAKCRYCKEPSVVHTTEFVDGAPQEVHLCRQHAREQLGEDFFGRVVLPFSWDQFDVVAMMRLKAVLEEAGLTDDHRITPERTETAVAALLRLLGDDDWRLRYLGAGWLGDLGPMAAAAAAELREALNDDDHHVRQAAEDALASIEGR